MRRAMMMLSVGLLMSFPLAGGGCVPQQKYDDTLMTHRSLQEQMMRLEEERDAANANLNALRSELARANQDVLKLQAGNARLNAEMDELAKNYDALLRRVAELQITPLPEGVTAALQELASAYPDLLSFDPRTGMLRFASDFTFDLGSADLQPGVADTIHKLASILNGDKARGFEVRVIGHTDNVRIAKADTARKHPTNVHLSAHRAISVRDSLVNYGVEAVRIMVAGYGEFRPVVTNGPNGAAANRRVEIFLLPMPAFTSLPAAPAGTSTPSPTSSKPSFSEPMK